MATMQVRARGAAMASPGALGLRIMAAMIGVFFLGMCSSKIAWLTDSNILLQKFQMIFLPKAPPIVRWYLETVCIPGTPLFARLVPLGELTAGLALILGFWTRMTAIAAFLMVLNFHFATSAFWSIDFLRDGTGLPLLGGLLALAISGARLPFSVSK
ncbi:MAG TPA: DoxX family membrane protein [Vicinamibacterales bacterium]|nr:DoxX family membrane protein [Vicinamibacterales bacterium]